MKGWLIVLLTGTIFFASACTSEPIKPDNSSVSEPLVFGSRVSIRSEILNEQRFIRVFLPGDYGSGSRTYSVIYLLDGDSHLVWPQAISSSVYLNALMGTEPCILVGIENRENRNRDTIPQETASRPGSGGAGQFLEFINSELKPYIQRNYRTNRRTIVFGGSNSGLFVVYSFLARPESFDAYIAASPMIGHCQVFMEGLLENMVQHPDHYQGRSIYFNYGRTDFDGTKDFLPAYYEAFRKKAPDTIRHRLHYFDDQGHVPVGSLFYGFSFVMVGD